jgi:hypothetical protein
MKRKEQKFTRAADMLERRFISRLVQYMKGEIMAYFKEFVFEGGAVGGM